MKKNKKLIIFIVIIAMIFIVFLLYSNTGLKGFEKEISFYYQKTLKKLQ